MSENAILKIGVVLGDKKKIHDQIQKDLDQLSKTLKLTIKNVNLAGTQLTQTSNNTTSATQKSTQALSTYEKALNSLIHKYKMKQLADDKFLQSAEKAMKMQKFQELSWKEQERLINLVTQAEKKYQSVSDNASNTRSIARKRELAEMDRIAQAAKSKTYKLNSGGSSSLKIYDDIDRESAQSSRMNTLSSMRSRLGTVSKSGLFSKEEIAGLNQEFAKLETRISKISNNKMAKQIDTDLGKVSTRLTEMRAKADKAKYSFGNMFQTGITKMLIWSASATAIFLPLRAFQEGLKTLKEIDTQLVDIAKVTNLTKQEMQDLAVKASDVGIELGRTTQEYLKSVAEFSRAGYGANAENLGKVSLLLQNVGDINEEVANSFLLAADAAYKFNGSEEKLTNTVNSLNNISNKNATTIGKVADGMSVSASIAEQAGVGIEELSGAISTMTIVTQRSGAEANNYLPMW